MFFVEVNHHNYPALGTTRLTRHRVNELVDAIEFETGHYFDEWVEALGSFSNLRGTLDVLGFDESEEMDGTLDNYVNGIVREVCEGLLREAPFEIVQAFAASAFDEHRNHVHVGNE